MNEVIVIGEGHEGKLDESLGNMTAAQINRMAQCYKRNQRAFIDNCCVSAERASGEPKSYYLGLARLAYEEMVACLGERSGRDKNIEEKIHDLNMGENDATLK